MHPRVDAFNQNFRSCHEVSFLSFCNFIKNCNTEVYLTCRVKVERIHSATLIHSPPKFIQTRETFTADRSPRQPLVKWALKLRQGQRVSQWFCQHLKSLVWPQAINRVCLYKVERITLSLNKTLTSKPIPPSASDYLKWLHSPWSERKRSWIHCASSHWWGFEEGGQVVVKEENGNQQLSLF